MKLPGVRVPDGIVKGQQVKFGGLNHSYGATDGELWDMRNLTSDYYPLLASRAPRRLYRRLEAGGGLFAHEELCWVDGTGFFYDGERKGTVTEGRKSFAALGDFIVILPDKAYYNAFSGMFGSLESSWNGSELGFTNGSLFDEAAEANTVTVPGIRWEDYVKAGDAVTISGCTKYPQNNKTAVIREIDGDKLYFYEYSFTLEGTGGTTPYTETGELAVKRTAPDLLYVCENENRLWGCDRTTIYASKPGDIFNWNVYEGLDTDAYAVDTGSAGSFTGCVSFLGYPVFFKEEHIYKVYGTVPSNFQVMGSSTLGVAEGSAGSLAIAGEMLFYLSRAGFMAFSGGIPQPVGSAFGLLRHRNAVAGSDGMKYYVSAESEDGSRGLHVYDAQRGLWHTEDETNVSRFAKWGGNLYFLNEQGEIWMTGNITDPPEAEEEGAVEWWAEFADFTEGNPNKKTVSKIQLRIELDEGARAECFLQFDSDGRWQSAGGVLAEDHAKRSYYLPLVPRRGDHFRLRIEGAGGCRVYSMVREYCSGSELKSKAGRQ